MNESDSEEETANLSSRVLQEFGVLKGQRLRLFCGERYLRQDLPVAFQNGKSLDRLPESVLVPSLQVLSSNLDLLLQLDRPLVISLRVLLQLDRVHRERSRSLVESAIFVPDVFMDDDETVSLVDHLRRHTKVVELTDDTAVAAYIAQEPELQHLCDVVAHTNETSHLSLEELQDGVKRGKFQRGILRWRGTSGTVTIRQNRIPIHDANRAVHNDLVAVELRTNTKKIKDEREAPGIANILADSNESSTTDKVEGIIVGILRRGQEEYCGSIRENAVKINPDGSQSALFVPIQKNIPKIWIRTVQRARLLQKRIIVRLDAWPTDSDFPVGHYVRTLGDVHDKTTETQVVLHTHKIPHEPFSAAVLACLPPSDFAIRADDPHRVDLRHIPVCSIDPPGCKDIDDALHCTELPNGNYQVGVHIADVTHYVKPNTPIDLEAANRSTSTYLVNQRLDMLPGMLTTDLCSLKGNVDRYAFSVLWQVTPDAEIVDVQFSKSIIHSVAALTYRQAQDYIEDEKDKTTVGQAVKRLANLARKFRARRMEAGALTLASPEVKCTYAMKTTLDLHFL